MGWTSYNAIETYKNGKWSVDRKAECDKVYSDETDRATWEVLKSAMVGSVYYAAVRRTDKDTGESHVFGAVCLTSSDKRNGGYNFVYKDMDESMGPCASKCPPSILDLLDPTTNEYALEWRERCRRYHADKKEKPNLGKLPLGTKIVFEDWSGKTWELVKCAPQYQFKSPWWLIADGSGYYPKRLIPANFRIVA